MSRTAAGKITGTNSTGTFVIGAEEGVKATLMTQVEEIRFALENAKTYANELRGDLLGEGDESSEPKLVNSSLESKLYEISDLAQHLCVCLGHMSARVNTHTKPASNKGQVLNA